MECDIGASGTYETLLLTRHRDNVLTIKMICVYDIANNVRSRRSNQDFRQISFSRTILYERIRAILRFAKAL